MKILLLGEYSNVHWTLAEGLRQLGHEVVVASDGDGWKNIRRDIDLSRSKGKLAGAILLLRVWWLLLSRFRGFDVVQLINPMFLELKAERLSSIYKYLRRHNKKLILGAFGMDYYWAMVNTDVRPLRYSDFNIGDKIRTDSAAVTYREEWIGTTKEQLNKMIAKDCDAVVSGLYEYDVTYRRIFPEKTHFIPFPIRLDDEYNLHGGSLPVKIFIGISKGRSEYKGTDIMLRAAEAVQKKYPDKMILQKVEGVPFDEYRKLMFGSDAIIDQLYSYTPSMNPLEAMSHGIICIGGGEPENYEILGEDELRPIINVQPTYESVFCEIEQLVLHPERIPLLKTQSREYIVRHHDHLKVAQRYVTLYNNLNK